MKDRSDYSVIFIAVACALAALFTILFLCIMPFNRDIVARRDYIVYWATGHQLMSHGNPYDAAAIYQIESEAGFKGGTSYYMRNAPWALPLAWPLGFLSARNAALPWSLLMLALLIASVRMFWSMVGTRGSPLDWLGYCFPPALFCVILGQTSVLLLFGLVLFLRFHKSRPYVAGAALWLCTIKPHLFLPFALVLFIWIVATKAYRVLAGGAAAMAVGFALTAAIDPHAWSQYSYYMHTSVVTHEFTACLGDVLRDSIQPSAEWLAFVPAMIGCIWAVGYFIARRHTWSWIEHGAPLILVSLLVAPFGWIFDQALVIPAILVGAARTSSRLLLTVLALMYLAIEAEILQFDLHSRAYLWAAPAWLVWYLLARAAKPGAESAVSIEQPSAL